MEKYITHGTCSKEITFDVVDGRVFNIKFLGGGCPGNTKGVAALANGQPITNVIKILKGITCRDKTTSCPDQLAQALIRFQEQNPIS